MFILVIFLASNLKNVIIRLGIETLELVTLAAFTAQMSLFTTVVTALFVTLWAITSHMSRTITVTTKGRIVSRTTISKKNKYKSIHLYMLSTAKYTELQKHINKKIFQELDRSNVITIEVYVNHFKLLYFLI